MQNTKKMRENFIEKLSDEEKTLQAKIDEIKDENLRKLVYEVLK